MRCHSLLLGLSSMITSALLDLRSDTGRQLLNKIAGKYRCPAYVLAASVEDLSTPEPGNETKFAAYNPTGSLPHWSPAATWVSYAYLQEQQHSLPKDEYAKIAGRLRSAGETWGITADLDAIDGTELRLVKEAADTSEPYPVRNAQEAAAAREFLLGQLELPRGERSIACEDRIKLAGQLVDFGYIDEPLVRVSCRTGCYDAVKVAKLLTDAIADRKQAGVADDNGMSLMEKVAFALPDLSPDELQKQQPVLAVAADRMGLFDGPAELELSVNSVDPVVILSNGCVVKAAHLQDMPDELYDLFHKTTGEVSLSRRTANWAKLASKVPYDVASEFVAHMEHLGHRCEVSGVASYTGSVIDAAKLFASAEQS